MGMIENDPRDIGYIALYTAIKWYQHLSSESALRIVQGRSHTLRGQKLTPEMLEEIKKIMDSPNFYNINTVVRKFRVNKYEILEALESDSKEGKITNEEVFIVPKIETDLKKLSDRANKCPGVNCDTCILNSLMFGENTLCEILCDLEFDAGGKLVKGENRALQEITNNCNTELLNGDTKVRGFEIYKSVLDVFDQHTTKHKDKKIRDMASAALLEYASRHKKRA
jgi:(2Fe-2S) ferredoxin